MNWRLNKKCMLISAIALTLIVTICVLIPTVFTSRASKTTVPMNNVTTNRITTTTPASTTTRTTVTSSTTTSTTATTATTTTTTTVTTTTTTSATTTTATTTTTTTTTSTTATTATTTTATTATTTTATTTTATTAITTTERSFITLTNSDDTIIGIHSTKAGQSVNGVDGEYPFDEGPLNAIDNDLGTKYLNFGGPFCDGCIQTTEGIDTGFIVIPAIGNATIARAIVFATANDFESRDPITVTLEGSAASDSSSLALGSSWTLLYTGPSGINTDPGRLVYGNRQSFPNTTPYRSYRLLVTERRGAANSVQYAEWHILGYITS